MTPYIDWEGFKETGLHQFNKPYLFGSKPDITNKDPQSFDCSGLVHWLYGQVGLNVPEGSEDQFEASNPVQMIQIGDVGFFRALNAPTTHHVGIVISSESVLEARGYEPSLEAQGIKTNCVLLRPREKWEAFSEFTGWRRFKAVMK